jgi:hypothetical protein
MINKGKLKQRQCNMSMTVDWYNPEKTIIKVSIPPDSDWDSYYPVIEWIVDEANKVDHDVYLIFHEEKRTPAGNPIPHLQWGIKRLIAAPNVRHSYIVQARGGVGSFIGVIMRTIGDIIVPRLLSSSDDSQLIFVADLEEALSHISGELEKAATIPDN